MLNLFRPPRRRKSRWQGKAVVEQAIQPRCKGRVRFQGSWWNARCNMDLILPPGEAVEVVGIYQNTLLVEPSSVLSEGN